MTKQAVGLSWRPISRGRIFCAPACGRGCTHAEHKEALESAARLCKELGVGWKPRVWENLGWHFEAISRCGRIKVFGGERRVTGGRASYHAFLGDAGSPGGRWVERARTARAAIRKVIKAAESDLRRIDAVLRDLPQV